MQIFCNSCEMETAEPLRVGMMQEFRGKRIYVMSEKMVCKNCDFEFLTDDQGSELYKKVKDKYNELMNGPANL